MNKKSDQNIKDAGSQKCSLRFYFFAQFFFVAVLMLAITLSACGYHRVRKGNNLPDTIKKVAIPVFRNNTLEAGLEAQVTDALREQFIRSNFVKIRPVDKADAVIVGTIKKFKREALSFSTGDYAVEYRIALVVSIKLVDRNGRVLWKDNRITKIDEYRVSKDIFETESAQKKVTEKVVKEMMADVHDRIFDGFDLPPQPFPYDQ